MSPAHVPASVPVQRPAVVVVVRGLELPAHGATAARRHCNGGGNCVRFAMMCAFYRDHQHYSRGAIKPRRRALQQSGNCARRGWFSTVHQPSFRLYVRPAKRSPFIAPVSAISRLRAKTVVIPVDRAERVRTNAVPPVDTVPPRIRAPCVGSLRCLPYGADVMPNATSTLRSVPETGKRTAPHVMGFAAGLILWKPLEKSVQSMPSMRAGVSAPVVGRIVSWCCVPGGRCHGARGPS